MPEKTHHIVDADLLYCGDVIDRAEFIHDLAVEIVGAMMDVEIQGAK